jgi:hypothetical protein
LKYKKSKLLGILLGVALLGLAPATAWCADGFQISPLPLAKNAKPKPDEFPEDKYAGEYRATGVRMTVLLGTRDYAGLEKAAQDWLAQYQAKKMDADNYTSNMIAPAPLEAGKGMLADVVAWTAQRPQSYAAWFALGWLYYDIAGNERGQGSASETTDAQFSAMRKYADLSHAAAVKSLGLTPNPIPSYDLLIRVATLSSRHQTGAKAQQKGMITQFRKNRFCPAAGPAADGFASSREEQIYYLCLTLKADPNATDAFSDFVYYNSPRWGGDYNRLQALLDEIQRDHRTAPRQFGDMKSYLLAQEAMDEAQFGDDPHAAAQLFVQAFDAAPRPGNLNWLSKAAWLEEDKAKDLDRSLVIFRKLADYRPGEWDALAQIGWIYEAKGDLRKYMEGMIAAANLGMKEAQNNVGYYYMVGQRGLPRDLQQAKEWLTLAANQGFEHSREKLKVVDAMIAKEKGK